MESKRKILYVEDNPENVLLIRRVLEAKGYEVLEAENGMTGIAMAEREHPDLILMDINLPDMDGYAAATKIKNTKGLEAIPIVALTANVMKGDRERTLTAGCDGYIAKPIDVSTFAGQVETFLKGLKESVSPEDEKVYLKEHSVRLVEHLEERIRELTEANEQRQRSLDKLEERTKELVLLLEITTTVSSSLNLRELLQTSAQIATERLGVTFCRILLINRQQNHLMVMAAHPRRELDGDFEIGRFCETRESEYLRAVQTASEPLLLRGADIMTKARTPLDRSLFTGGVEDLQSLLICPVSKKSNLLGLLVLGEIRQWERSPFAPGKVRLCDSVARQMAGAIENARLFEEVVLRGNQIKAANLDSIKALASALETKDVETMGHSDRTVEHALLLGRRLGFSENDQEVLQYAAILHDIGKIGIPESILKKPGKLTADEYEVMKQHPVLGAQIIQPVKFLEPVVPLVRADHERWDGKGYPNGLRGEEIPLGARVVALVDAYDAMTFDRVYRKAPGKEYAVNEMQKNAGTQFDPQLVKLFLEILKETP
ncbi:MAG TPA: HD domain-containing phosphohydrolase [Nitrospiria bacterium]|nr:HD domain-containing phosphohydrolase [Nitrospiria bacterium]